jgi:high affinity sulfate transporter 1
MKQVPEAGSRRFMPVFAWLPGYRRAFLRKDALAGLMLALYAIPQSMAYAALAGLSPVSGIYCYIFAGLLYFAFGTSRHLAIGPTSAISMIIGVSVASLAGGDPARAAGIAAATALVMALLFFTAWLIRLNTLVTFISDTVLTGFKAGAAMVIIVAQLPKLFGLHLQGADFFGMIGLLFSHLPEMDHAAFFLGVFSLAFLVAGHYLLPGKPVSLLLVAGTIMLIMLTPLGDMGIPLLGEIRGGLPVPALHLPEAGLINEIFTLAVATFLLSYIESTSTARSIAREKDYDIDTRQELLALGASNLASSIGNGFPVAGGLSQSTVGKESGSHTQLTLVFTSLFLVFSLYFLSGFLGKLPQVVLAVIVIYAVTGLFDFMEMKHLLRVSREEFTIALLTIVAVLIFGILAGVLIAVIFSILVMIRKVSDPHIAVLGNIPGTPRYSDMLRHPENKPVQGMLILRVEASILYFNHARIREQIDGLVRNYDGKLKQVVIDLSSANHIDIAGARFFLDLEDDLEKQGIRLRIVDALSQARDILRAEGMEQEIGHISRKVAIHDLVTAFMVENSTFGE